MNCSISGEVPKEPVVSKKSGLLYEKRLIERHISDYGKCPITGEPLDMDDIVPITTSTIVKPRPAEAASIPGMFKMLKIGWDDLVLSNFALTKELFTASEDLSFAKEQRDAACSLVVSLCNERDELRSLLATGSGSAVSNGKRASDDDELGPDGKKLLPGISSKIAEELNDCNAALSQQRKRRQISSSLALVEAVERYTELYSHPLHRTNKPGILSVDLHNSKDIIATGGMDTNVVVFNKTSGEIITTLSGHSKKVTSVRFVADSELAVTGSADKTVRVWKGSESGNYDCQHILKDHTAEVQAVTVHATNNYFSTASLDSTWCFYDIISGSCLAQVSDTTNSDGYTSAAFHPDGLILGTGTSGALVEIWDVKSLANLTSLHGHVGAVTAMSFSENGYFLATAAQDGVKLWDLRKLRNFRTLAPYNENTPTQSVDFDHSGSYLAIGGSDIRVCRVANVKDEWNCIKTLPDLSATGKVSAVKFGPDAKYLAVGSMDSNLRIFGLPGEDSTKEL